MKRLYVTSDLTIPISWFTTAKYICKFPTQGFPTYAGAVRSTVHLAGWVY